METPKELLRLAKEKKLDPEHIIELAKYGVKYLELLDMLKDGIVFEQKQFEEREQEQHIANEKQALDKPIVCPIKGCGKEGKLIKRDGYWVAYHEGGDAHYLTRWLTTNNKTVMDLVNEFKKP